MEVDSSHKLDPDLKSALEQQQVSGRARFLMMTAHSLDDGERAQLEREGCQVTSTFGNVVTGFAPLDCLPQMAALDFVTHIELARKLHLEQN